MNDAKVKFSGLFVDWLTIWQIHAAHAPINSGCIRTFDGYGQTVFERHRAARIHGSHSTSCSIKSDGSCVVFSGNFGRFNRLDNLFNFDPLQSLERANAVAEFAGFPSFQVKPDRVQPASSEDFRTSGYDTGGNFAATYPQPSYVQLSRVDLTQNYSCGSPSVARSVIQAISGKNISRVKKGIAGDSSVWWSNTRYMLKVYVKYLEMEAHGVSFGEAYEFAKSNGIVRLELELKRRELHDLGWNDYGDFLRAWDMGNVHKLFADYAKVMDTVSISNEAEFLDSLPQRLRVTAAAFLQGHNVKFLMSNGGFYRHRKALLDYGIDISDERPARLNVQIQTVQLVPIVAPDWYWKAA